MAAEREIQARLFAAGDANARPEEIRQAFLRLVPEAEHKNEGEQPNPESGEGIVVHETRPVKEKDLIRILQWFSDPETQNHLSPLPKLPQDWSAESQVMVGLLSLAEYYDNKGEPQKITALAAVNEKDKALGVVTIRWKGDPYIELKKRKIASVERLLINPKIRKEGIGRKLVERSLEIIFDEKDYVEARAWVMSDDLAEGWGGIVEFFAKFGFDKVKDEDASWAKYQEVRNMEPDGRDAWWLKMEKEDWDKYKKKNLSRFSALANPPVGK